MAPCRISVTIGHCSAARTPANAGVMPMRVFPYPMIPVDERGDGGTMVVEIPAESVADAMVRHQTVD